MSIEKTPGRLIKRQMDENMWKKFEESPKHVLAAASLISNGCGQVLLIEGPGRGWECPGGRIEEGEDLFSGLKREIFEESGAIVNVGPLAGIYFNLSIGIMIFCFLSTYVSGELTTSPESLDVKWFSQEESLKKIAHPVVRDRVQDMLNYDGRTVYKAHTLNPYRIVAERYL